jgi:hypothetical protein
VHSVPTGSVLLIVVVDVAIIAMLSMFIGILVARAAGAPIALGIGLGLVVPLVGPLVWMVIAIFKDTSLAGASRIQSRGADLYCGTGLLALSAVLFLVAVPLPWGSVDGYIREYSLVGESSAADTGVGLFVMVGTAALLIGVSGAVLLFTTRRRAAIVASVVGAAWLLTTVDGLIMFSAVNDLSRTVGGLSGGRAAAAVAPGGGLYVSLVASVAAVAGGSVLGLLRRDPHSSTATPAQLARTAGLPYVTPAVTEAPTRDEF